MIIFTPAYIMYMYSNQRNSDTAKGKDIFDFITISIFELGLILLLFTKGVFYTCKISPFTIGTIVR